MTALEQFYDELKAAGHQSSYAQTAEHYPYALPEAAVKFDNLDDMKRRVIASGSHYFDRQAIRFFRGRTSGPLFAGRFWVESRKFEDVFTGDNSPREYQVAYVYTHDGSFLTVEKLGSFDTLDKARKAAKKLSALVVRKLMDEGTE